MSGGSEISGSPLAAVAELLLVVGDVERAEVVGDADADVVAEAPLAPASVFATGWLEPHPATGRTTAAATTIRALFRAIRISQHPRYRIPVNDRTRS